MSVEGCVSWRWSTRKEYGEKSGHTLGEVNQHVTTFPLLSPTYLIRACRSQRRYLTASKKIHTHITSLHSICHLGQFTLPVQHNILSLPNWWTILTRGPHITVISLNISGRGRPTSFHPTPCFLNCLYKANAMFHFLSNFTSNPAAALLSFDPKMLLKNVVQMILPSASLVNAQFSIGTYTSLVGGLDTNSSLLGNYYN